VIILFSITELSNAQNKEKKFLNYTEFSADIGTIYDSNILKYSDKYIEKFLNNEDQGRFLIKTYDDLYIYSSLKAAVRFNLIKQRSSKIRLIYTRRTFLKNNIKSWDYFKADFLQRINKRALLNINYSYIPDFYIRHFRDFDWVEMYGYSSETFQEFAFSKDNFGVWFQYTFFSDSKLRFNFNYSEYFYNEHFTEYDCKNFQYGLNLYQPVHPKIELEIGLKYGSSETKELDEQIYRLNYSDASYYETVFLLGVNIELPNFRKYSNGLNLDFSYNKRSFTSTNTIETDPLHAGRTDDNFKLKLAYRIQLTESFTLSAFYDRRHRYLNNSAEANKDFLIEEKNYNQYLAGFKLLYTIKLKH